MQTVDVDLSIPGAPPIHPSPPTLAQRHALHNWQINLAALDRRQSQLAGRLRQNPLHARWIYARDGSLTTLDASDRWLGGCSVPERASMQVIQRIESRGTLCLVAPPLPHLIRRMLNLSDLSELTQAMIVILPDLAAAAIALHCCDFSDAIERNRLWLAAGINWQSELSVLLRSHPGLPLPQQFTRTLVDEETAAPLIVDAQCIFTTEAERRSALLRSLRSGPRNLPPEPTCQLCLLASSRFRLWDCAGDVLHGALASGGMTVQHIDPDDPCSSGNLSLALAAARAQAVITSNSTRAELAALVPASVPIVTWMTSPAIPPFEASDACDFLLLADPSWKERAEARGWPLKQLRIAHWPSVTLETAASSPGLPLALIANTRDVSNPPRPLPLSSHRLLWELIRDELLNDPCALSTDVGQYLSSRMARLDIRPDGFDAPFFAEHLVVPAYQQGIARLLHRAGLPVRLHGEGWQSLPQFTALCAGSISSSSELRAAISKSIALIHAWPSSFAHAVDACPLPVIRSFGRSARSFLADARKALGGSTKTMPPASPLSAELITSCLQRPPR